MILIKDAAKIAEDYKTLESLVSHIGDIYISIMMPDFSSPNTLLDDFSINDDIYCEYSYWEYDSTRNEYLNLKLEWLEMSIKDVTKDIQRMKDKIESDKKIKLEEINAHENKMKEDNERMIYEELKKKFEPSIS